MRRPRTFRAALAVVAAVFLALAPAAFAWNPSDLYRELRCPTCNSPLDVSNAPAAQRIKVYVLERWRKGWSEERVKDALVADFGRDVLATPPKSGFDLIAWVVPGFAVVGGLIAIIALIRLWSRRKHPAAEIEAPLSPEDEQRLKDELARTGGL